MPVPLITRIRRRVARTFRFRSFSRNEVAGTSAGLTLELTESSGREAADVRESLYAHNFRAAGDSGFRILNVFLRNSVGQVVGGLLGSTYWQWMSVDYVWIDPRYRGHRHSHRLFEIAEQEAIRRSCRHAFLDTFSFQDRVGLYESLGYRIYGVLEDFPPGHRRFFLKKDLRAGAMTSSNSQLERIHGAS